MRTNTTQVAQIDLLVAATEAAIHRRDGEEVLVYETSLVWLNIWRGKGKRRDGRLAELAGLELESCCHKSDKASALGGRIDKSIDDS